MDLVSQANSEDLGTIGLYLFVLRELEELDDLRDALLRLDEPDEALVRSYARGQAPDRVL